MKKGKKIDYNKILAIIPARGGSKGVPRKNIKSLCGKPLICYSIKAGLESKYIDRVVVSTEDKEIAAVARKYNAEVIDRPKELAKDNSPAFLTYKHVLENLKEKGKYFPDIVTILQPTSPLRKTEDVDESIEIFVNNSCDSVISVTEDNEMYWGFRIEEKQLNPIFDKKYLSMNRKKLPKLYRLNGAVFVSTPQKMLENKGFHGEKVIPYVMPPERSIDIDTVIDFKTSENLMKERGKL